MFSDEIDVEFHLIASGNRWLRLNIGLRYIFDPVRADNLFDGEHRGDPEAWWLDLCVPSTQLERLADHLDRQFSGMN